MGARPQRHRDAHVVMAWVRPWEVAGRFLDSITAVMHYDHQHQGYLAPPGGSISMQSSPRIAEARSQVVDTFLHSPLFKGADWLWWTDADATFSGDILAQLMRQADVKERPIVGALAFGGSNPDNLFPTVYRLYEEDGHWGTNVERDYPRDALVKVGGTGCHCVLIHKRVFIEMGVKFATLPNGKRNPYPWYSEGHIDPQGRALGEDIAFCIRAQSLGIPVHIHTGIKTGHLKAIELDEELWDRKLERDAAKPRLEIA